MSAYPEAPGHRDTDTSFDAARSMDGIAGRLRQEAFKFLTQSGGATADEVAAHVGVSVLAMRPRITELKQQGVIVDSGLRRLNRSGRRAAVLAPRKKQPSLGGAPEFKKET